MEMSPLEILANVLTLASVLLTVHLKRALYPVGLAATILFFFVFWQARLYASAGLQVYFTLVQLYGWWFWSSGDRGRPPPVGNWPWRTIAPWGLLATVLTGGVAALLYQFTDASMPFGDTAILALSILAQFLLDRKQIKSWIVWGVVDVLSITVYATQGLWLTAGVYVVLLVNVLYGWVIWRRTLAGQTSLS